MEETLIGLLKTENKTAGNVACHRAQGCTDLRLENGFFFVHTTRGNATLTDPYRTYELAPATLAILTPSISARLHATTQHFRATLLYIVPSYFDSLPDSHPLYTQLSAFLATFRLPVIGLEKADSDYLQQTLQLFTDRLTDFRFYGNSSAARRNRCRSASAAPRSNSASSRSWPPPTTAATTTLPSMPTSCTCRLPTCRASSGRPPATPCASTCPS